MRNGFTTGSCATVAAKAAAYILLSGKDKNEISIKTPSGIVYETSVEIIEKEDDYVCCGVIKDSGDDPDITNGTLICSKVSYDNISNDIRIIGGTGVGKVTRPGLEMPVGEWAINSVPRKMIEASIREVSELFDYEGGFTVEIIVPEGEDLALKTFNPHMGIEGGISILGTSGIVEPMSLDALLSTIKLDLSQKRAEGDKCAVIVPGNYGETFLKNEYDYDASRIVHFSNYIGQAIDYAVALGFDSVLVVGHTGKLVKVSGGIMNTHSKEADCRMELMAAALVEAAVESKLTIDQELLSLILSQVTTTAVLEILKERQLLYITCNKLLEKILFHLRKRAESKINIQCILYENSFGLLAKSEGAEELL